MNLRLLSPGGVLVGLAVGACLLLLWVLTAQTIDDGGRHYLDIADKAPQCGSDLPIESDDLAHLYPFGKKVGVRFPATFARVVDHLFDEDRLPECYVTKDRARAQGWARDRTLADVLPGLSIGGDFFGNREGHLPPQYNGSYRSADLDYVRGTRGAVRLVYVHRRADEGLIWVTTDHYDSFTKIYCGPSVCD